MWSHWARFILAHRFAVAAVLVCASGLMLAVCVLRLRFESGFEEMFAHAGAAQGADSLRESKFPPKTEIIVLAEGDILGARQPAPHARAARCAARARGEHARRPRSHQLRGSALRARSEPRRVHRSGRFRARTRPRRNRGDPPAATRAGRCPVERSAEARAVGPERTHALVEAC